jgi:hypothetical protein
VVVVVQSISKVEMASNLKSATVGAIMGGEIKSEMTLLN